MKISLNGGVFLGYSCKLIELTSGVFLPKYAICNLPPPPTITIRHKRANSYKLYGHNNLKLEFQCMTEILLENVIYFCQVVCRCQVKIICFMNHSLSSVPKFCVFDHFVTSYKATILI